MEASDQDVDTGRPRPVGEITDPVLEILNGMAGGWGGSCPVSHCMRGSGPHKRGKGVRKRDTLVVFANGEKHDPGSQDDVLLNLFVPLLSHLLKKRGGV